MGETEYSNEAAQAYREIEANKGAGLPHRDQDPIMRFLVYYFGPADFMFEQFRKLDKLAKSPKGLSRSQVVERRYFLIYWLSSLYVAIEGAEALLDDGEFLRQPLKIPQLSHYLLQLLADVDDHRDALRLVRNATFHFQKTAIKHVQFFDTDYRLEWAAHIHRGLSKVASEYRIECAIICALAGRKDEIDMKSNLSHKAKNLQYFK